jgi:hypothetical protein
MIHPEVELQHCTVRSLGFMGPPPDNLLIIGADDLLATT